MHEINVTPLVDVMLVLLVIFIITAPLMASALKLDLPQARGAPVGTPQQAIRLAVDAQGRLYLDDQAVEPEALASALHARVAAAGRAELPEVHLRADQRVPYGRVAEVMALAQQAGLMRIAFMTDATPPAARAASTP